MQPDVVAACSVLAPHTRNIEDLKDHMLVCWHVLHHRI
jgi:hypothetical protein